MKRRGYHETMLDILGVLKTGHNRITKICYASNTCYRPLLEKLKKLYDLELITFYRIPYGNRKVKQYHLTNRGEEVLMLWQELKRYLREV